MEAVLGEVLRSWGQGSWGMGNFCLLSHYRQRGQVLEGLVSMHWEFLKFLYLPRNVSPFFSVDSSWVPGTVSGLRFRVEMTSAEAGIEERTQQDATRTGWTCKGGWAELGTECSQQEECKCEGLEFRVDTGGFYHGLCSKKTGKQPPPHTYTHTHSHTLCLTEPPTAKNHSSP